MAEVGNNYKMLWPRWTIATYLLVLFPLEDHCILQTRKYEANPNCLFHIKLSSSHEILEIDDLIGIGDRWLYHDDMNNYLYGIPKFENIGKEISVIIKRTDTGKEKWEIDVKDGKCLEKVCEKPFIMSYLKIDLLITDTNDEYEKHIQGLIISTWLQINDIHAINLKTNANNIALIEKKDFDTADAYQFVLPYDCQSFLDANSTKQLIDDLTVFINIKGRGHFAVTATSMKYGIPWRQEKALTIYSNSEGLQMKRSLRVRRQIHANRLPTSECSETLFESLPITITILGVMGQAVKFDILEQSLGIRHKLKPEEFDWELVSAVGDELPYDYWLTINNGILISMPLDRDKNEIYMNNLFMRFMLIVYNMCDSIKEIPIMIPFKFFERSKDCHSFTIILEQLSTDTEVNDVATMATLYDHLVHFVHRKPDVSFQFKSFKRHTLNVHNLIVLKVQFDSIKCQPCNISALKELEDVFVGDEGEPTAKFTKAFGNLFKPLGAGLNLTSCLGNSPPITLISNLELTVGYGQIFEWRLPMNLFYDAEDGFTPNLRVKFSTPFEDESDIIFNPVTKILYVMPDLNQPIRHLIRINLIAIDKFNSSTSIDIILKRPYLMQSIPSFILNFEIECKDDVNCYDSKFMLHFFSWVAENADAKSISDYALLNQAFEKGRKILLTVTEHSTSSRGCNLDHATKYQNLLASTLKDGRFFYVSKVKFQWYGLCYYKDLTMAKDERQLSPARQPLNNNVMVSEGDGTVYGPFPVSFCSLFSQSLPHIISTGENVTLHYGTDQSTVVSESSWLQLFPDSSNMLYGVLTEKVWKSFNTNRIKYNLQSRLQNGTDVKKDFHIILPNSKSQFSHYFTIDVSHRFQLALNHLEALVLLVDKIGFYMMSRKMEDFYVIDYNATDDHISLKWSNCSLSNDACYSTEIVNIASRLHYQNGEVSANFINALLPEFSINTIELNWADYCASSSSSQVSSTQALSSFIVPGTKFQSRLIAASTANPLEISSSITAIPNTRPIVRFSLPPVNASYCSLFTFFLPQTLFFDQEDGYTRSLELSLTEDDGSPLSPDSWIQLRQNLAVIYGVLSPDDVEDDSLQQTYLVHATDSSGLTATTPLHINMPINKPVVYYSIELTVTNFFNLSTPLLHERMLLLLKILTYYEDSYMSSLELLRSSRNETANRVTLGWTNCTLSSNACPERQISDLTSKIINMDGSVNEKFAEKLMPQYVVLDIEQTSDGVCIDNSSIITVMPNVSPTPTTLYPIVINEIGVLNASTTKYFVFEIPWNAFYDKNDGYTRQLSIVMVTSAGNTLPYDSWIQFNVTSQTIYGMLYETALLGSSNRLFEYSLLVTNSRFYTTVHRFLIHGIDPVVDLGLQISIHGIDYYSLSSNNVDIGTSFFRIISTYLDYKGDQTIEAIHFQRTRTSPHRFIQTWANTSLTSTPCKYNEMNEFVSKFKLADGSINPRLMIAFYPYAEITDVNIQYLGSCNQGISSSPPSPSTSVVIDLPPRVTSQMIPFPVSFCHPFSEQIPNNLFYDNEDGDTTKLKLRLLSEDGNQISKDSWIQLSDGLHVLYGIFSASEFINLPPSCCTYHLEATDSAGQSATTSFNVRIPLFLPPVNHNFMLTVQGFYDQSVPDVNELLLLTTRISQFFGDSDTTAIRIMSFERDVATKRLHLVWANCTLPYQPCPIGSISNIAQAMLSNTGEIKQSFRAALQPNFNLFSLKMDILDPCKVDPSTSHTVPILSTSIFHNTPPVVIQPIGTIKVTYGLYSSLVLPENTFFDAEDGNARSLRIDLFLEDGSNINKMFWLQFNKAALSLNWYPNYNEITSGIPQRYLLIATDSGGLITSQMITFTVDPIESPFHRFTFTALDYYSVDTNSIQIKASISEKIRRYLNDPNESSILFLNFVRVNSVPQRLTFIYTNTSLKRCDIGSMHNLLSYIFVDGNPLKSVQPNLLLAMPPEMVLQSAEFVNEATCLTPTSTSPFTPLSTAVFNSAPKTNYPFINVSPSLCEWFEMKLRNDLFEDVEDGDVRNLRLVIVVNEGLTNSDSFWLQVNNTNKHLYGAFKLTDAATSQNSKVELRAYDSGNKYGSLAITISPRDLNITFVLTIKTEAVPYSRHMDSDTTIQKSIIERLSSYFRYSYRQDIAIIQYRRSFQNVITFTWSSCRLAVGKCTVNQQHDFRSMLQIGSSTEANPNLLISLTPILLVLKVDWTWSFECNLTFEISTTEATLLSTPVPFTTYFKTTVESSPVIQPTPVVNHPPVIINSIPTLKITPCSNLNYQIPGTFCFDSEDGYTPNLNLQLMYLNGTMIQPFDWIQLRMTQEFQQRRYNLEGIIVADMHHLMSTPLLYRVICYDSEGLSVSQTINVEVDLDMFQSSHVIRARSYIYLPNPGHLVSIQIKFQQKLQEYLSQNGVSSTSIQFLTYHPFVDSFSLVTMSLTMCSIENICQSNELLTIKRLFIQSSGNPSVTFIRFMAPDFGIIALQFNIDYSQCYYKTTLTIEPTPTPSPDLYPKVIKPLSDVIISICRYAEYNIPSDTFYDQTDGTTRNLILDVTEDGNVIDEIQSWFVFNPTTQALRIYPRLDDVINGQNVILTVTATNSLGFSVNTTMQLRFDNALEQPIFYIQTRGILYSDEVRKLNFVDLQRWIHTKLAAYFQISGTDNLLFKSMKRTVSTQIIVDFAWNKCTLSKSCNLQERQEFRNKLVNADGSVYASFISILAPDMIVTTTEIAITKNCPSYLTTPQLTSTLLSSSPKVSMVTDTRFYSVMPSTFNPTSTLTMMTASSKQLQVISTLIIISTPHPSSVFSSKVIDSNKAPLTLVPFLTVSVGYCVSFAYQIPANAWTDEDGDSRKLKLELLNMDGSKLDRGSWVQFHSELQVIYGQLLVEVARLQPLEGYSFLLTATDSKQLSSSTTVRFQLPPVTPYIFYTISIDVESLYDPGLPFVNDLFQLNNKLSNYLNASAGPSFVNPVSLTVDAITNTKLSYRFTDCALNRYTCPNERIRALTDLMLDANGKILEPFKNIFAPQYILRETVIHRYLTCSEVSSSIESSKNLVSTNVYESSALSSVRFTSMYSTSTYSPFKSPIRSFSIQPSSASPVSSMIMTSSVSITPPTVINPLPDISVDLCSLFTYRIPANTFYDSIDGFTQFLTLRVTYNQGELLGREEWLHFNTELQSFYGILSVDILKKYKKGVVTYLITAINSKGLESSTQLNIILPVPPPFLGYLISIDVNQLFNDEEKQFDELLTLLTKVSRFYGYVDSTNLLVSSFTRLPNRVSHLEYSSCAKEADQCNTTTLAHSVVHSNGSLNLNFVNYLRPQYFVFDANETINPRCNATIDQTSFPSSTILYPSPYVTIRIVNNIPVIIADLCSQLTYNIPENTFYDDIDGGTRSLTLSVMDLSSNKLSSSSWLQFYPDLQQFYGYPKYTDTDRQPLGGYQCRLVATNSRGQSVSVVVVFKLPHNPPPPTFSITIEVTSNLDQTLPEVHSQISLATKLSQFFGHSNFGQLAILSFEQDTFARKLSMTWTNCSYLAECKRDIIAAEIFSQITNEDGTINLEFQNIFLPEFFFASVSQQFLGVCNLLSSVLIPTSVYSSSIVQVSTSIASLGPQVIKKPPDVPIFPCKVLSYQIPDQTFFSDSDGTTRNLALSLSYSDGRAIEQSSWIQFLPTLQLVFGTITEDVIKTATSFTYIVTAKDKLGRSASTPLRLFVSAENIPFVYFKSQLTLSIIAGLQQFDANILITVRTKLSDYLLFPSNTDSIYFLSYNINRVPNQNQMQISWTACLGRNSNVCPFQSVDRILNLVRDQSGELRMEFRRIFASEFVLISESTTLNQPCYTLSSSSVLPILTPSSSILTLSSSIRPSNKLPQVLNPIRELNISLCGSYFHQIPRDTFFDQEDGDTRNLKLELLFANMTALPTAYWLQFIQTFQIILAYPTVEDYKEHQKRETRFALKATDSSQHSAVSFFAIIILDSVLTYSNNISLSVTSNNIEASLSVNHRISLANKISTYFGDSTTDQIILRSFTTDFTVKTISMMYSNCSLSVEPCPSDNITSMFQRISADGISPTQSFANIFGPDYALASIDLTIADNCTIIRPTSSNIIVPSSSTVIDTNTGPISLRNISISVTVCQSVRYTIPADAFYDREDGDARFLSLSLLQTSGSPLPCSSWINFDRSNRLIYGQPLASMSGSKNVYKLRATDSKGSGTDSFFEVSTIGVVQPFGLQFTFLISSTSLQATCTANFIREFFDNLALINNIPYEDSIQLQSIERGITTSTVRFGNCSIRSQPCDNQGINVLTAIFLDNNTPSTELQNAMAPNFMVLSLQLEKSGSCQGNSPPTINRPIQTLSISYCSPLFYQFLDSDITDAQNGGLSNLKATLYFGNRTQVPDMYWINYDKESLAMLGRIPLMQSRTGSSESFSLRVEDEEGAGVDAFFTMNRLSSFYKPNFVVDVQVRLFGSMNEPTIKYVNYIMNATLYYLELNSVGQLGLQSYSVANGMLMISFTVCSLPDTYCDFTQIKDIQSKLHLESSEPNPNFVAALLPLYFVLSTKTSLFGICLETADQPPIVINLLPRLTFSQPNIITYKIPEATFFDNEDGMTRDLSLELLGMDKQLVKNSCAVDWRPDSQELIVVPTSQLRQEEPSEGFKYLIRAKDRANQSADAHLNFTVTTLSYSFSFVIEMDAVDPLLSCVEEEIQLVQRITNYFNDSQLENVLLDQYIQNGTGREAVIANASARLFPCNYILLDYMKERMIGLDDTFVNQFFFSFMQSNFRVRKVTLVVAPQCEDSSNIKPNARLSTILLNAIECERFQWNIPQDLFSDAEDGGTDQLNLSLLGKENRTIERMSWLTLFSSPYRLLGFPPSQNVNESLAETETFQLVATDSRDASAIVKLVINKRRIETKSNNFIFVTTLKVEDCQTSVSALEKFYQLMKTYLQIDRLLICSHSLSFEPNCELKLNWTIGDFQGPICNITRDTELLYKVFSSSMLSVPSNDLINYLQPEFVVQSIQGVFTNQCVLSRNTAPKILKIITLNVTICNSELSFIIPEDTFYDIEDGNTRQLSLNLQLNNYNEMLSLNKSNQEIKIYPILSSIDQGESITLEGTLTATDKEGLSNSSTVTVTLNREHFQPGYIVTLTGMRNIAFAPDPSTVIKTIYAKLSDYLTIDQNEIVVISSTVSAVVIHTIQVGFCSFKLNDCRPSLAEQISKLLIPTTGQPSSNNALQSMSFESFLLPEFVLQTSEDETFGNCLDQPPIPITLNLTLTSDSCGFVSYVIENSTFIDEDGGAWDLSLSLTREVGLNSDISSLLELHETDHTIQGIIRVRYGANNIYNLTARDSKGQSTSITLIVVYPSFASINASYEVRFLISSASVVVSSTDSSIANEIFTLFTSYFNEPIRITQFLRTQNVLTVTIALCSSQFPQCPVSSVLGINSQLYSTAGEINADLKSALGSNYTITRLQEIKRGDCSSTINTAPKIRNPFHQLNASVCEVFNFKIPIDTFIDSEDGPTRDLFVNVLNSNGELLQRTNWVQFNVTSQTLTAVARKPTSESDQPTNYEYIIRAYDKEGLSVSFTFNIKLEDTYPNSSYLLRFQLKSNIYPSTSSTSILVRFLQILSSLSQPLSIQFQTIGVNEFQRDNNFPEALNITLTNCSTVESICLTQSEVNQVNDQLNSVSLKDEMLPHFQINIVEIITPQRCRPKDQPPYQNATLPVLTMSLCNTLNYTLPIELFLDDEDGNMLDLAVQVVPSGHTDGFVLFESATLQLLGRITNDNMRKLNGKDTLLYDVIVSDSSNNTRSTLLTIKLPTIIRERNFSINFEAVSFFLGNEPPLSIMLTMIDLIKQYLNDDTHSSVQVHYFHVNNTNPINIYIQWSNCTVSSEKGCNMNMADAIELRILTGDTVLNPQLVSFFFPRIALLSATVNRIGDCQKPINKPPTVSRNLTTLITQCGDDVIPIPLDLFEDEDGDITNLTLRLISINGTPVTCASPFYYEQSSLSLKFVRVKPMINARYDLILRATDQSQLSSDAYIQVSMQPSDNISSQFNYDVSFQLVRSVCQNILADDINTILRAFLNSLNLLGLNLNYFNISRDSTSANASWGSCYGSTSSCQNEAILQYEMALLQSNWIESLPSNVKMISNKIDRLNKCKLNSAPILINPLPILEMSFCLVLKYRIPPETFYDEEDGFTRNLTITITEIKPESGIIMSFDAVNQTVTIYALAQTFEQKTFILKVIAFDKERLNSTNELQVVVKERELKTDLFRIEINATCGIILNETQIIDDLIRQIRLLMGNPFEPIAISSLMVTESLVVVEFILCNASDISRLVSLSLSNSHGETQLCNITELTLKQPPISSTSIAIQTIFPSTTLSPFSYYSTPIIVSTPSHCLGNTPPRVIDSLGAFTVLIGQPTIIQLPVNTFYDDDDGLLNGTAVVSVDAPEIINNRRWIYFDAFTYELNVLILNDDLISIKGVLQFHFKAIDSCGRSALDVFSLTLESPLSCCILVEFVINISYEEFYKSRGLQHDFYNNLTMAFEDSANVIRYFSIEPTATIQNTLVKIANASIGNSTCNRRNLIDFIFLLFDDYGTPKVEFMTNFREGFVVAVGQKYSPQCNSTQTILPIDAARADEERAGQEFLLYLIPFLVTAFLVLFCFLVHYGCKKAFTVRIKKEAVVKRMVKEQHAVGEILPAKFDEEGKVVPFILPLTKEDGPTEKPQYLPKYFPPDLYVPLPARFGKPQQRKPKDSVIPNVSRSLSPVKRSSLSTTGRNESMQRFNGSERREFSRDLIETSTPLETSGQPQHPFLLEPHPVLPRRLPAVPRSPPPPYTSPNTHQRTGKPNRFTIHLDSSDRYVPEKQRVVIPVKGKLPVEFQTKASPSKRKTPSRRKKGSRSSTTRQSKHHNYNLPLHDVKATEIPRLILPKSTSDSATEDEVPVRVEGVVRAPRRALKRLNKQQNNLSLPLISNKRVQRSSDLLLKTTNRPYRSYRGLAHSTGFDSFSTNWRRERNLSKSTADASNQTPDKRASRSSKSALDELKRYKSDSDTAT